MMDRDGARSWGAVDSELTWDAVLPAVTMDSPGETPHDGLEEAQLADRPPDREPAARDAPALTGEGVPPDPLHLGDGWVFSDNGDWGSVRISRSTGPGQMTVHASEDSSIGATTEPQGAEHVLEEGLSGQQEPEARGTTSSSEPDESGSASPASETTQHQRPATQDLTPEAFFRSRPSPPRHGWRAAVHRLSGGRLNLGPSKEELQDDALTQRVRSPIGGCYRIAVISLKGGVGKTTTAFCIGATLASLRGDRIIAIDANPDVGTLAEHVVPQTSANLRDLLAAPAVVETYAEMRRYTSQSPDRLEVLASPRDPGLSHAFDADDYARVMALADRFYTMTVTDCGTGMMHSAMEGVLAAVDQIVLVSSASLDGARSASATLDWLEAQGHERLASQACVVVNCVRPHSDEIDVRRLAEHFERRTRCVVAVPYDAHLARGTTIELARLSAATRRAWTALSAEVVTVA